MKKADRKRRAREMKRKAKEAKQAKREQETSVPNEPAPHDQRPEPAPEQPSEPTTDEMHQAHAKMNWAEADTLEAEMSAKLGDDEAAEMLTRAARALAGVIEYAEGILKRLPQEQVAEAIRIQNRPRSYGEKSRNGMNTAVQLLNILLRAKALMVRVVKLTNPELAKRLQAKA